MLAKFIRRVGGCAMAGLLAVASAGSGAYAAGSGAHADSPAGISSRGTVVFQGVDGHVWVTGPAAGSKALDFTMMPGSSPDILALPTVNDILVFQGSTGTLWIADTTGAGRDTGYAVMAGTSPSRSINASFEVAFQGTTGTLWTLVGNTVRDLGYPIMPGTSPGMVSNFVVFQGTNGNLWTSTASGGGRDTGLAMMPGTSPAVGSRKTIAFQTAGGHLFIIDALGRRSDTGFAMAAGGGPRVSANGDDITTRIAFQGANGNLWTTASSPDRRGNDRGLPVMPGTRPAIGPGGDDFAFQGLNGNLWTISGSRTRDSGIAMMAGTSPS